jgi:hypothetical protein
MTGPKRPTNTDLTHDDFDFSNLLWVWDHVAGQLYTWAIENDREIEVHCDSCGESIGSDAVAELLSRDLVRQAGALAGRALRDSSDSPRTLSYLDITVSEPSKRAKRGNSATPDAMRHSCVSGDVAWSVPEGTPPTAVAWTATCDGCGEERQVMRASA